MKRVILFLSSLFFLSGCSSLPESLNLADENVVTDYQQVKTADVDAAVRLGGIIAKVNNTETQTRLEVVNLPIGSSGKPDINQEPDGRFVVYVDQFLDPITYATGRLVTVAGKKEGVEKGKIEGYSYEFPVLNASGQHLWRIEERVDINHTGSYIHNCRGVYCRSYYGVSSSRQGRVVKEVR